MMNFTKVLCSSMLALAMTSPIVAAGKIEEPAFTSSNWTGSFTTHHGPTFNHLPGSIFIIYQGPSSSHVLSQTAFSFSQTSGIDDWKPSSGINLQTAMTAQQFFDELNKATDIVGIQPPALARFLGK